MDEDTLHSYSLSDLVRLRLSIVLDGLAGHRVAGLYHRVMNEIERVLIEEALARSNGSQVEAAAFLGIHRNTLRNRMKKLEIVRRSNLR